MILCIGNKGVRFFKALGHFMLFVKQVNLVAFRAPIIKQAVMHQMFHLGNKSFAVVTITALFIGMAFSLQV